MLMGYRVPLMTVYASASLPTPFLAMPGYDTKMNESIFPFLLIASNMEDYFSFKDQGWRYKEGESQAVHSLSAQDLALLISICVHPDPSGVCDSKSLLSLPSSDFQEQATVFV